MKASQAYVLFYTRRRHVPTGPSSPFGRHSCPGGDDVGAVGASGARTIAPGVGQRGGGSSEAVASVCNGVIGSGGGIDGIHGIRENGKPVVSKRKVNVKYGKLDVLQQLSGDGSSDVTVTVSISSAGGEGTASKRPSKDDRRGSGGGKVAADVGVSEGVLRCRVAGKKAQETSCEIGSGAGDAKRGRLGVNQPKRGMVGEVEEEEEGDRKKRKMFSPREGDEAWGELLAGMSSGGSTVKSNGAKKVTPDSGDSSHRDRGGISSSCEVKKAFGEGVERRALALRFFELVWNDENRKNRFTISYRCLY